MTWRRWTSRTFRRSKKCQRPSKFERFLAGFTKIDSLSRYRHAAPSAPWPWMDFNMDVADVPELSPEEREGWKKYPQSHFGNWTPDQVKRCGMLTICQNKYMCYLHKVDVLSDGIFDKPEKETRPQGIRSDEASAVAFWNELQGRVSVGFTLAHWCEPNTFNSSIQNSVSEPFSLRPSPRTCCRYLARGVSLAMSAYFQPHGN